LWTCTRAPSTFHSSEALPSVASAPATSSAGVASIGWTGRISWIAKRASPAAPSVSAAFATAASPPASIVARRTSPAGRLRGGCDRVEHHAFERALPELADDQAAEKIAFVVARAGKQRIELRGARARRALAARRLQATERCVHLGERQRFARALGGSRVAKRCVAEAELALRRLAAEIGDGDPDLVRLQRAQERREGGNFGEPPGATGDALRRRDEIGEARQAESAPAHKCRVSAGGDLKLSCSMSKYLTGASANSCGSTPSRQLTRIAYCSLPFRRYRARTAARRTACRRNGAASSSRTDSREDSVRRRAAGSVRRSGRQPGPGLEADRAIALERAGGQVDVGFEPDRAAVAAALVGLFSFWLRLP
jgi:hypothetical protein